MWPVADQAPTREPPPWRRSRHGDGHVAYRAIILAAGLIAAGLLFGRLVTLLVAILITVIIAVALSAVATRLERYRVPRPLGALIALLAGAALFAGVIAIVIPPLVSEADSFIDRVPEISDSLLLEIRDVTGAEPGEVGQELQAFLERLVDNPERLIGPAAKIGFDILGLIAAMVLILITAYYMAARPRPLIDGVLRMFPPDRRPWAAQVMDRMRAAWIGWMRGVAIDMLVSGLLLYIGLSLIGLDFALLFAVLGALLVVIPYFGSFIGGVLPVLYALTQSFELGVLTLVVYLVVQQIEGNIIIPLVMAQTVKLHPAVIAVGVVLVAQLFGVIGLFIAVPILSAIVILTEELWIRPMEHEDDLPPPEPTGTAPV